MTAEISIMNTKGLAMAADSAVTIGGRKVMNNARKLFTLDSRHSVGVMIFGNADILGVPWEVILNEFRSEVGNIPWDKLECYCKEILSFTQSFVKSHGRQTIDGIISYALDLVRLITNEPNSLTVDVLTSRLNRSVPDDMEPLDNFTFDEKNFEDTLLEWTRHVFSENFDVEITPEFASIFIAKLGIYIRSQYFSTSNTGLVIAGYGKTDVFPEMFQYTLDAINNEILKYTLTEHSQIGNKKGDSSAVISPFAQQEMVHTILKGIDPQLNSFRQQQANEIENSVLDMVGDSPDKIIKVKSLFAHNYALFDGTMRKNFVDPIIGMVETLSLPELGSMANTLVSLTSFKRKFSNAMETVGGPIDVLVISKGEGPVWIARKTYFDKSDNLGYIGRKINREGLL